ncbi:hypothetical protein FS749_013495 [Ceratobasidium sp. UAMH 11750]|nr:hypothetical protein FS749_013495 [Ceratobasidium sp. UAMH 11750]
MQHPRIAIIGSGPSGLAPAKLFLNRSTVPHVFERDLSTDFRPQGGTHDLHEHSVSRQSETKIVTKEGKVLVQYIPVLERGGSKHQLENDRFHLRAILLQSVGPDVVRWGHVLESVEPGDDGTYSLRFKDGKIESGYNLVVGTDGTWSRLNIPLPEGSKYDEIYALVGRGSVYAFGDQKEIMAQR